MSRDVLDNSISQDGDDIVDRAVAALRDEPIPLGPSAQAMQRTRAALNAAVRDELKSRRSLRPWAMALAAAAVVAICVAVGITILARHHTSPIVINPGPKFTPTQQPIEPVSPTHPQPVNPVVPPPIHPRPVPTEALASGVIMGRVVFEGPMPQPAEATAAHMMPECIEAHGGPFYDESVVVSPDRNLANVVVSVSSGLSGWLKEEFPPPSKPAVLDQRGCVFEPHVVAVMVGQPLIVKNSDPMLHNVHILAVNNPAANLGQPTIGETFTSPFESPEVFQVKCDIHPWMNAWVRVLDNPFFAVTGKDGQFTIRGLPAGTYTLKAWHEQLGVREMQITIGPDHGESANFVFMSSFANAPPAK